MTYAKFGDKFVLPFDLDILGEGIYSPAQAARLIGSTSEEVLRWTRGYKDVNPLWDTHYKSLEESTEISFSDLIELRVVKAFRNNGISLQAIRFAIRFAEENIGVERPMLSMEFRTEGSEILAKSIENDGDLISLSKRSAGQKVWRNIVEQSLNDLEYEAGEAVRWRPHRAKQVIIDPNRQFGEPILDEFGISTKTIFDEFNRFKDIKYLSLAYEIPLSLVKKAIDFEESLNRKPVGKIGTSSI